MLEHPKIHLPNSFISYVDQITSYLIEQHGESELSRFLGFVNHLTGRKILTPDDARQRENNPSELWFPGLTAKPWHDANQYDWCDLLKQNYPLIRNEFQNVLKKEVPFIHPEVYSRDDFSYEGWDNYHFQRLGGAKSYLEKFEKNLQSCPKTAETLSRLPLAGDAKFAVLKSKGFIKPHFSNFNALLVCHLGLDIPPGCSITVAGEERYWKDGEVLLFDDTYLHEVSNRSDYDRAILLMDLWHPDLTSIEVACLNFLIQQVSKVDLTEVYS